MNKYKGEIRNSEIDTLKEKVQKNSYSKYLRSLRFNQVRAFNDLEVRFDFPVTALIGPNGGGKSTILGASAIAYKEVRPRRFFAKSGKYDDSMADWSIEYDIIDRTRQQNTLQRTANFRRYRWNRDPLDRKVLIFGVSRTVPANEQKDLAKAMGAKFIGAREEVIEEEAAKRASWILGKDVSRFQRVDIDEKGSQSLLTGATEKIQYSEFHFGAGEASVIKMISEIESSENGTLVLIEEIENGLHPVATRRMVEYLIKKALNNSIQVIFTTHSNDAIDPLPSDAIWAAYSGQVLQGKLDIESLRTLTGQIDAKLVIYVEDSFAKLVVEQALRLYELPNDSIKVHYVGGYSPAIAATKQRNIDPAGEFPALCLLDGDRPQDEDHKNRIFILPGKNVAPDAHVFDYIHENIDNCSARIALALGFPSGRQSEIVNAVRERHLTNQDKHIVYAQVGEDLGMLGENQVKQAFINEWANSSGELDELFHPDSPLRKEIDAAISMN